MHEETLTAAYGIRLVRCHSSICYIREKSGFAYLNFNELPVDSRWRQAFISGLDQGASLSEVWSEQMDMLFYIDLNYDVYYDKTFYK
ncbi:hypothetical protein NXY17_21480 (plasmid) [Bacteroides fragilis]|nr:hypothetical protein [Bacteroides fragilis]